MSLGEHLSSDSEDHHARVARYHSFAKAAAEQAQKTTDPKIREDFLNLHRGWLQLAEALTRNSK